MWQITLSQIRRSTGGDDSIPPTVRAEMDELRKSAVAGQKSARKATEHADKAVAEPLDHPRLRASAPPAGLQA